MSTLRQSLERGSIVFGCFSMLVEPVWVEMLALAGFDFVVADCEESPGDNYGAQLDNLVRAAEAAGADCVVRTVEATPGAINRALNTGASGIWVPHVRTAAAAQGAVEAARYPPVGRRGAAPVVRGARYGLQKWDDFHREANEEKLVFIMVEDLEGVANIEEIVRVPGVDGIMVGTWDLSVEMGEARYGPLAAPVMEKVEHVISVTREAGLFMAGHAWSGDIAKKYVDLGCQLLFVSLDANLLIAALGSLKETAAEIEAAGAGH